MKGISIVKPIETDETCEKHGIKKQILPISKADQEPVCPICMRERIKQEAKDNVARFVDTRRRTYIRSSIIDDPDVKHCSLDNFKQSTPKERDTFQLVRKITGEYFRDKNKEFNTLLLGSPGSGKTHLAWGMLNAINDNAKPAQQCLFINFNRALNLIKSGFDERNAKWTDNRVIKLAKEADVIVLDDLGTESAMNSNAYGATQWVQSLLFDILNAQKRVIVTSNLSLNRIQQTYDPKIVSRLLRGSKGHIINFSGIADKRINELSIE